MIKVLIVDDELLVRIGLRTMVDWDLNGYSIVGEAANANEAIELFDKFEPDIVISDIKMSGMDGLDLIAALREKDENFKTIILTHCDDFSYAQKAIKLGTSEFILKSNLTSESLLKALNKISKYIEPKSAPSSVEKGVSEYLHNVLEKAIVTSIITKTNFSDYISKDFNRNLFKYSVVVYGRVFGGEDGSDIEGNIDKIKELSSSVFKSSNVHYTILTIKDHIIYLLNFDSKYNNANEQCVSLVEGFRRNIEQYFDVSIMLGVSNVESDIMLAPQMVDQAKSACEECFFADKKITYFLYKTDIHEKKTINVKIETVRKYVKDEDLESLNSYIDLCFDEAFLTHDKGTLRKVFIDFISYAKIFFNEKEQPEDDEHKFRYGYFDKIMDFDSIKTYVKDVYEFVVLKKKDETYSYSINKSIQYIKENYTKNITLEDVSEYANISKSYLSLLFKQETGINFSSYLSNYRIDKSIDLIRQSNYKIYEIAEKVGFDNPYYFSKIFKDKTGLSCKEYRKNTAGYSEL